MEHLDYIIQQQDKGDIYPDGFEWTHSKDVYENIYEWLFKHHFDVFGLIDKGLALNKLTHP